MTRFLEVSVGSRLVFRGCTWDDGWEFDAPSVLYSPVKRYGWGGNSGTIDRLVEDVCESLATRGEVITGWDASARREFKWRRWWSGGFRFRRNAWHVRITVEFIRDPKHGMTWNVMSREKRRGITGPWRGPECNF